VFRQISYKQRYLFLSFIFVCCFKKEIKLEEEEEEKRRQKEENFICWAFCFLALQ
jgi:hypothetical protein